MDSDTLNRLFVVCGRAIEVETLQETFQQCGPLQQIRLIKEKGVAYVTYSKASSAALAIESLHEAVLNNGCGPKLKVMLADAPNSRLTAVTHMMGPHVVAPDPDNMPPRSRLFLVVPKHADQQQIQLHVRKYPHLETCKTDLVATKGIVFCKFDRASAALAALEDINLTGLLAGYKVKCMLAKPKIKCRMDAPPAAPFAGTPQGSDLGFGYGASAANSPGFALGPSANTGLSGPSHLIDKFGVLSQSIQTNQAGLERLAHQGALGYAGGLIDPLAGSPVTPDTARQPGGGSRQRLFVVVHKGASEDLVHRLFRRFPGMEYCDLKKDHTTGKSKGFCFVNYSTPMAAAAAIEQLHGTEFPPHSGHHIKVLYAEPLAVRHSGPDVPMQMSPSPEHAPAAYMSTDMRTVGQSGYYLGQASPMTSSGVSNPGSRMPARKLFDQLA